MLKKIALAVFVSVILWTDSASAGVVYGSTWYSDGSRSKTVGVGDTIRVYATGAFEVVPYRLVICSPGVEHPYHVCEGGIHQVVNPTIVYAGPNGIIGTVRGTVTYNVPGTYQLVFYDASANKSTGTGGGSITIAL